VLSCAKSKHIKECGMMLRQGTVMQYTSGLNIPYACLLAPCFPMSPPFCLIDTLCGTRFTLLLLLHKWQPQTNVNAHVVHKFSSETAQSEQALHEKSEHYQDLYTSDLFDVSTVICIKIELLTAHLQMT
jgi:hypothetical protein